MRKVFFRIFFNKEEEVRRGLRDDVEFSVRNKGRVGVF